MSIRPHFKFYFKPDETNWYTVTNDVVLTTSIKTALQYDPVDWSNTQIAYVRHEIYRGVMRAYTAPITFCEDGALILRNVYYTKGFNGRVIFEMEMIGENTQAYANAFSGEVVFSEMATDSQNTFQTSILDKGLIAKIKARQNVPYTMELLDEDCVMVKMDGVKLKNQTRWTATSVMATSIDCSQHQPELSYLSSEAPFEEDIRGNVPLDTGFVNDIVSNSYFFTASQFGEVVTHYKGDITFERPMTAAGNTAQPRICLAHKIGSNVYLQDMYLGPQFSGSKFLLSADFTLTTTVSPGDQLALIIGMEPFNSSAFPNRWWIDCTNGKLTLDYWTRGETTIVRGYRQIDVWRYVIASIAGDLNWNVVSDYLTNPNLRRWGHNPYNTILTSGDGVRGIGNGFEGTAALMKIKLTDLFADLSNRDAVGMTVEGNTVKVEVLPYFFDATKVALELDLVDDFVIEVDKSMLFNVLNVGYEYEANDLLNGKQDPHTTFTYGAQIRYVDQTQNWISPFTASMYAWEFMRRVLKGKNTQDSSRDNSIFLLEIDPTPDANGFYVPYRPQNIGGNYVQNIEAGDSAINLTLMPEYNLRRKSGLVHGSLHLITDPLVFQKADQNQEVISKIGSAWPEVKAKDNLFPADMDAALYLPLFFKFRYPVDSNFDATLSTGKNQLIGFKYLDKFTNQIKRTEGFLEKVVIVNGEFEASEWILHAGPNINLPNLIR